ncbi:unnamed protein product [Rotaria magnacalcarata]|uniref:Metalloendopeptidase n=2 Tax=Rotaria magnacalcarata TaxID=392030 RepID=A0A820PD64_9BILA|nr:unnamed protein product [Rotaria magnacalcarata]CAF1585158.1 unnamed protein product [Rotaria magnacalcarata]CAF2018774.1 unnamed protein product [Rotaria magnacalcarata]CAF2066271.1 unnamed protein product [Rotaria magnacalcarata]CAF4401112.1 unnamed protein product [Rotaria magnacalcarata]
MLQYVKLFLCLIFLSCKAYAIPLEDSGDAPNLFGLEGLSENNAIGANFIEGDIAVPLQTGRAAYIRSPKWPNGIVPFDIHSLYTNDQKSVIRGAMSEIMKSTNNCIRFVERNSSTPVWLRIFPGQGCWSYMGRVKSRGAQDLSLQATGCVHHSVALHELTHALGFVHEQTRPDRNQYVLIQTENIQSGKEHNFNIFPSTSVSTLNLPYDYGSIMHYRSDAFSSNGRPTIKAIIDTGKDWDSTMGRGKNLSNLDIAKLKAYYSCS